MRILIVKVPHEGKARYTWMVAYSLPFTPIGACNFGAEGDFVSLHLTVPKTPREEKAQEIFRHYVEQVANDMKKAVHVTLHSTEAVVAVAAPGMSLSWMTDHRKKEARDERTTPDVGT